MRSFINTKGKITSSRLLTEPSSQPSRKMTDKGYSYHKVDNLGTFHDQLILKQKLIVPTQRRTKSTFNPAYIKQKERRKSIRRDLMNAAQEINSLRKEISDRKLQITEHKQQNKLNNFIDMLKMSIDERNVDRMVYSQRSQAQPIFYPIPIPCPAYNYPSERLPSIQRESRQMQYSNLRNKQREKKNMKLRKNKAKFNKVANAILFTIYLKLYCKRIRQARKHRFNQLYPLLQPSLNQIISEISKLLKPFFKVLIVKRQVIYDIQKNEDKVILKAKVEAIRRLVNMLLQIVKQWMQASRLNKKVVQTLYYLCRHGNYSCTVPILTPDQLQVTCISAKFGYVSANHNLQNSAFINFIIIKIVIYNILLSPQKIFTQFQDDNLNNNLYVIASVLYELAIDLQDQYILLVPKSYKIDNSKQVKGVVPSRPLLYKNSLKIQGELISGLKQQTWTKKYFNFQSWNAQKQLIKQTINIFHYTMVNFHKHMSKKYF